MYLFRVVFALILCLACEIASAQVSVQVNNGRRGFVPVFRPFVRQRAQVQVNNFGVQPQSLFVQPQFVQPQFYTGQSVFFNSGVRAFGTCR